ncbi:MAG: peptidylprolyl isomerase [Bacteroidaceae bacterium]|nr:peptidylprolyl isomerase [Bacteroidaceae bacterium]
MKKYIFGITLMMALLLATNCKDNKAAAPAEEVDGDTIILDADQYVRFETTMGNFTLKLYREAPLHRHSMVRQARKGIYDGQLFFGVQKGYKIQCGDPYSKNAKPGEEVGVRDEPDTIKSEINPSLMYHKRGAVGQASLRQFEFSTSRQFYIVTGTKSNRSALDKQETVINKRYRQAVKDSLTQFRAEEIIRYRNQKNNQKISSINNALNRQTDAIMASRKEFRYSPEQIEVYTKIGGTPSLDGLYTVFGEVCEGLDVVEAINGVHIDKNYRPQQDIRIIKAYVLDEAPGTVQSN